jgi:hypothetical protein
MLATVLAQPLDTPSARRAAWRQAIDLLAQHRTTEDDSLREAAADLVRDVRGEVPMQSRIAAARALIGQRVPPALVALFAEEPAPIAAPVLTGARIDDSEWLALLPRLSPTARSLLRHRSDLSPAVAQALASFGASDLIIDGERAPAVPEPARAPAAAVSTAEAPVGGAQIRDLVARIEAFRKDGPQRAHASATIEPRSESFRFETSAAGVIIWVDGAPRAALIGETIAVPAEPHAAGVDGQAAGAYRQRAPFRDARLAVAGIGGASGEWRISAVPVFDPHDGRFQGYRGGARRPRADEIASGRSDAGGLFGTGLPADSLRQLVHELRTPLNAIIGFSEMIERQMLGPAPEGSRGRASNIQAQAARLLAAIDDLDMAARIETRRLDPSGGGETPAAAVLRRLETAHAAGARARGATLEVSLIADPGAPAAEAGLVERMFSRLLAATIGMAGPGEAIVATLDRDAGSGGMRLDLSRPAVLAGCEERALLDPGYSPDGEWPDGPALGLGFALRLVRNLAVAAGGSLDITGDRFTLRLPAAVRGEATEQA